MVIIAIESALEVAIRFGDTDLIAIYKEALANAGINYEPKAARWN